jgi:predicted NUDIX family phosphoesterase
MQKINPLVYMAKVEVENMSEEVLAFPAKILDELGKFQGVLTGPIVKKYITNITDCDDIQYIDRDVAEQDPSWKQLIPYCMLRHKGSVFVYQRSKKGNENRLHDLLSLGVGGHINPGDGLPYVAYQAAFERELSEEVVLNSDYRNTIVGLLYDESNEVGKVHFGIVHRLTLVDGFDIKVNDPALTNGSLRGILWIKEHINEFENWSQLCIKELL